MLDKWSKARESPDERAMGDGHQMELQHPFFKGICAGVGPANSERGTSHWPALTIYSLATMHHGLAKPGMEGSLVLTLKLNFLHNV